MSFTSHIYLVGYITSTFVCEARQDFHHRKWVGLRGLQGVLLARVNYDCVLMFMLLGGEGESAGACAQGEGREGGELIMAPLSRVLHSLLSRSDQPQEESSCRLHSGWVQRSSGETG